jgi:thymidine kinase
MDIVLSNAVIDGWIGPMKSSKSRKVAEVYNKITRGGKDASKVAVIVPAIDTRSAVHGCESRGSKLIVATHVIKNDALDEIDVDEVCKQYEYFLFDEAHFIKNVAELMVKLYLKGGKIYFSALDQNYASEPWPETTKILSVATQYRKLTAQCDICSQDASFTRLKHEYIRLDNEAKTIIGDDPYTVLCLACALVHDNHTS